MKKFILLLMSVLFVLAILSSSCDSRAGFLGGSRVVSGDNIKEGYQVVEIEGCEYIYYSESRGYSGYGFLAHKGNCKNPIHNENRLKNTDSKVEKIDSIKVEKIDTILIIKYVKK